MTEPETTDIPRAVAAYIESCTRPREGGGTYLVNEIGVPFIDSYRPGCPSMTPDDLAAWTRTHRPDLWNETK